MSSGYSYSADKSITSIEMMCRSGFDADDIKYLNVSLTDNIDESFANINQAINNLS